MPQSDASLAFFPSGFVPDASDVRRAMADVLRGRMGFTESPLVDPERDGDEVSDQRFSVQVTETRSTQDLAEWGVAYVEDVVRVVMLHRIRSQSTGDQLTDYDEGIGRRSAIVREALTDRSSDTLAACRWVRFERQTNEVRDGKYLRVIQEYRVQRFDALGG